MKIVIHGTELDQERIDGTRIYLSELIKRFASLNRNKRSEILLCHKGAFNPAFSVSEEVSYRIKKLSSVPLWTQTIFSYFLLYKKPDVLWMPVQNLPRVRPKNMKSVVTIHDLAFKSYPEMFPRKDLWKLNVQTDYAVKHASHLITVSQATKDDLLKHYSFLIEEDISIVHHGFDPSAWQELDQNVAQKILQKYRITQPYIVYVGAVQPRKNIITLIKAFEKLKIATPELQLVCVGADAWMAEETHKYAEGSVYAKDIIFTSGVPFSDLKTLLSAGEVFVLPSVQEGFGIPVLEAFASRVPVIAANSGSLPEVIGDAAKLFDPLDVDQLVNVLQEILSDHALQREMINRGVKRLEKFSWDKTAKETLAILKLM